MKKVLIAFLLLIIPIRGLCSSGAVILYDHSYVKFFSSGRKIWREEKAVKIKDYKGIKDFGEIVIPFSTQHQRVRILYAYTQLPDGRKIKPSKKAINIVYPPFQSEAPIYSDLKYKTISMPAVSKGVIIKYAFEVETFKPYMKGEFWAENFFQDEYPVKEATFTAVIPSKRHVKIKQYNMKVKPRITKSKGFTIYRWTVKDVPPIEKERNMPPINEVARKVVISSLKSWDQVASWYSKLSRNAFKPDRRIRETVAKLTRGLKSREEKIRAIYNFVSQNIRYVGMEFGINGYKPHSASEVLKNRYGDCKDHATLLISMLKVIGIRAFPVLIPTQSTANMDVDVPKPTSFNHEIAALREGDRFIFLDTTSDVTPFGELPAGDQGRRVLIVMGKKALISETPVFPPSSNVEGFSGSFRIDSSGRLEGRFSFIYRGVYAGFERYRLKSSTAASRKRHIENLASKVSPGFDVDTFSTSNFRNINSKSVRIAISGNDRVFGTKTEHMMLFHVPAPDYSRIVDLVAPKTRKYTYRVGYRMMKESFVTVQIPENYSIYFLPEPLNYSNRVGSLKTEWINLDGRRIKFHFKMVLNRDSVPPELYGDLRDLFNLSVKSLRNQIVVLKRKTW